MKTPLLLIYCMSVSYAQIDCSNTDDDELCESSGDGLFEGSGYAVDENDYKEPRLNEIPSDEGENSTLFDMISGKKFLAAVVSGSCVGLLLASMAMCLVLCRARKDNNVRRYGYQPGKSDRTFA